MVNQNKNGWRGRLRFQGLGVLGLLLMAAVSVFGQGSTGTILGTVKDATGSTVAGATVTVTSVDTGAVRTGMTGEDGAYRFPELLVGNYEVSVMKDGFQIYDRKGITLEIAEQAVIDATLQVGSTGQTVTVTEEAPLVNTTGATLGGTVNEQKVEDLPLNGRNFVDLSLMQTGVTQTAITTGPYGMGGTMYSSNGATLRSNQTTIDGATMQTLMGLSSTSAIYTTLGIDGIKEYKVVTNMFSAEYGLATGSQTTIVSKGGSNQWHGDVFEYLRNSALDANDYFNTPDFKNALGNACDSEGNKLVAFPCKRIPPYKRNNFGGSFGGPIKKDKTFFYAVYEGLREHVSEAPSDNTFLIGCYVNAAGVLNSTIQPTINNIVSGPGANPYLTLVPQTNGVAKAEACTIPTSSNNGIINVGGVVGPNETAAQQAVAQAQILQFASLYPMPTPGLGGISPGQGPGTVSQPLSYNYEYPFLQPSVENYEQLRFDENLNANDSAFLRYTVDKSNQYTNGSFLQWYARNRSLSAIGSVSETHIFTPTLLNTFRLSFSRSDLTLAIPTFQNEASHTGGPALAGVLIPGRDDSTGIGPGSPITSYGTAAGGNTTGNASSNTNGDIAQNVWSVADDVFWTKGKHALKFGTLLNHYTGLFRVNFTYEGSLSWGTQDAFFADQWSAVSAPTLGGGITIPPAIAGFGGSSPQNREYWWNTMGFYLQDDYRILPRVTLNLGLRYEFMTLPQAPPGVSYTVITPYIPTGQPITGPADGQGVPGQLWGINNSLHNFSPRFGFAWDVFGDGKTSLRGGGGIYYDIADLGTSIAGNATGDPSLSALQSMSVTYPAGYVGLPPIPLSISGLSTPGEQNCFTPTCADNGFVALGGVAHPPAGSNAAGAVTTVSLTSRVADYRMQQPTVGEWNLTLDRQLPFGMGLTTSYVGSKSWHVMQTNDGNPTLPSGFLPNGLPFYCVTSLGAAAAGPSGGCATNTPNLRPNTNLGSVQYYTAAGDSYYHSLQVALNKRLNRGLQFQLSYTFAKALDDGEKANSDGGSGALSGQTESQLYDDKGPAFFDVQQNLRVNMIYHVPNVKWDNFAAKPLQGWWLGTIISSQTGFPINIIDGTDRANAGLGGASGARPNLGPSYNPATVVTGNPNDWFNTTMFQLGPAGQFGNAPRDGIRGPRLNNLNLSLNKDTPVKWLGEGGAVQFRLETFNLLNHPNFLAPSGSLGYSSKNPGTDSFTTGNFNAPGGPISSGNPGQILNTTTRARQIQLALKIVF